MCNLPRSLFVSLSLSLSLSRLLRTVTTPYTYSFSCALPISSLSPLSLTHTDCLSFCLSHFLSLSLSLSLSPSLSENLGIIDIGPTCSHLGEREVNKQGLLAVCVEAS
jgi:hypothetical protein